MLLRITSGITEASTTPNGSVHAATLIHYRLRIAGRTHPAGAAGVVLGGGVGHHPLIERSIGGERRSRRPDSLVQETADSGRSAS